MDSVVVGNGFVVFAFFVPCNAATTPRLGILRIHPNDFVETKAMALSYSPFSTELTPETDAAVFHQIRLIPRSVGGRDEKVTQKITVRITKRRCMVRLLLRGEIGGNSRYRNATPTPLASIPPTPHSEAPQGPSVPLPGYSAKKPTAWQRLSLFYSSSSFGRSFTKSGSENGLESRKVDSHAN